MSRKKVIIVNNLLGYYGAENVLINMVNNLDQKKYEVTVLTLNESDSSKLVTGIKYRFIFEKYKNIFSKIKNKLKLMMAYKKLAKIYCSGYDVAVAFKMGESSKLVGFCDAPKKFCWIHSNVTEIEEDYSYGFKSLSEECEFLTRFNVLVAVSKACSDSFEKKYGKNFNIKVIYNPIDAEKIKNKANEEISKTEYDLFDGAVPIIGTVARIDSQKGIDRLFHISERLLDEKINHKLIIVGDGVDFKKYSNEVNDKHINNIYMLGFRSNPYKYIKRFNLFICSSYCESYSIVINEALVLGIPVVSTKCGGPEEVLQYGKYGVLTENNEEDLYSAVRRFLLEGASGIETYNGSNSMAAFIKNIDKLFWGNIQ